MAGNIKRPTMSRVEKSLVGAALILSLHRFDLHRHLIWGERISTDVKPKPKSANFHQKSTLHCLLVKSNFKDIYLLLSVLFPPFRFTFEAGVTRHLNVLSCYHAAFYYTITWTSTYFLVRRVILIRVAWNGGVGDTYLVHIHVYLVYFVYLVLGTWYVVLGVLGIHVSETKN